MGVQQLGDSRLGTGCHRGKKGNGQSQGQKGNGQQSQEEQSGQGCGKEPASEQPQDGARQLGSSCTATGWPAMLLATCAVTKGLGPEGRAGGTSARDSQGAECATRPPFCGGVSCHGAVSCQPPERALSTPRSAAMLQKAMVWEGGSTRSPELST